MMNAKQHQELLERMVAEGESTGNALLDRVLANTAAKLQYAWAGPRALENSLQNKLAPTISVKENGTWKKQRQKLTAAELEVCCHLSAKFGLDPLVGHIDFLKTQGGTRLQHYVTIDGMIALCNGKSDYNGHRTTYSDKWVDFEYTLTRYEGNGRDREKIEEKKTGKAPEWCEVTILREGIETDPHREWFVEVYRDTGPWNQGPARQMKHKAFRQAGRYTYGFSDMLDRDEAMDRMREIGELVDREESAHERIARASAPATNIRGSVRQFVKRTPTQPAESGAPTVRQDLGDQAAPETDAGNDRPAVMAGKIQRGKLVKRAAEAGMDEDGLETWLADAHGIDSLDRLTEPIYKAAMAELEQVLSPPDETADGSAAPGAESEVEEPDGSDSPFPWDA